MKIKNKNLRKYKIKNFFFFKSKLEQEIKIRKNPEILPGTLTLGIFKNWDNFFCPAFSRKTQNKNKNYK